MYNQTIKNKNRKYPLYLWIADCNYNKETVFRNKFKQITIFRSWEVVWSWGYIYIH